MNRIDRLHAILTHLQSKKRVTAQEIADRFDISLRTVYRDVKALDESGVPVIGEAGTGYTIMEGYRLPPVMFTQEEANALLIGAKLAEKMADGSVQKHFEGALFKIKAVLRATEKEGLDHLTDNIAVLRLNSAMPDESSDQHMAALQRSIVEKRVLFIKYQSNYTDDLTERIIEPVGLWYYSQYWHLIGWCRLRNGYRDFRVSNIQLLQLKDERFNADAHPTLQDYIDKMVRHAHDLKNVSILLEKEVAKHIKNSKYFYGYVREEDLADGWIRMHFLSPSLDYFARWLLMFTKHAKIESPIELTEILKKHVQDCYVHYLS